MTTMTEQDLFEVIGADLLKVLGGAKVPIDIECLKKEFRDELMWLVDLVDDGEEIKTWSVDVPEPTEEDVRDGVIRFRLSYLPGTFPGDGVPI